MVRKNNFENKRKIIVTSLFLIWAVLIIFSVLAQDLGRSSVKVSNSQIINQYTDNGYIVSITGDEAKWVEKVSIDNNIATIIPKDEKSRTIEGKVVDIPSSLPVKDINGVTKSTLTPTTDAKGTYFSYTLTGDYVKIGTSSITIVQNVTLNGYYVNTKPEFNFSHLSISNNDVALYAPFDINSSYSNSKVIDYSYNNKTGTLNGATWQSSGYIGGSYYYNGSEQNIAFLQPLTTATQWTIFFRLKWYDNLKPNTGLLAGIMGPATNKNYFRISNSTSLFNSIFVNSSGTAYTTYGGSLVVNKDLWQDIALSWNGTGIAIYLNGTLDGVIATPTGLQNGSATLYIGDTAVGTSDGLNGTIDSLFVFNKSFTSDEILSLRNTNYSKFYSSGTVSYPFIKLNEGNLVNVTLNFNALNQTNISARTECSGVNSAWQYGLNAQNITLTTASGTGTTCNLTLNLTSNSYNSYTPELISPIYLLTYRNTTLIPAINFTSPTPANNTLSASQTAIINVSINSPALNSTRYNFNGNDYWMYDSSLILALNFDNVSALGENESYIRDYSMYNSYQNASINFKNVSSTSSGKYGGGYAFNGFTNQKMTLGSSNKNPILNASYPEATISYWIYRAGNGSGVWDLVFVNGRSDTSNKAGIWTGLVFTSGKRKLGCYFGTNMTNDRYVQANSWVYDNSWYYMTCVYNGTTTFAYVNGVLDGNTTYTDGVLPIGPVISTGNINIGITSAGNSYALNGTLDELRIWNRSLTASEVQEQYYSNLRKVNNTDWMLRVNQSFVNGANNYSVCASLDSENCTETRKYSYYPPISFSNLTTSPNNNTQFDIRNYFFNVTLASTNNSAGLEFNNVNYTLTNSSDVYGTILSNLSAGTYYYYYWGFNSMGIYGTSSLSSYVIPQNSSYLLSITGTSPIGYPKLSDFAGTGCPSQLTCSMNLANASYGAGSYMFNYSTNGNVNYSATSYNKSLIVTQNNTLLLGLIATTPITYGTATDFAGSNCPSQLTCSLNISNAVYSAGVVSANYSTSGNVNYSATSTTFSVTIDKANSQTSLTFDKTSPQEYETLITPICSKITGSNGALTLTNGTSGVAELLGAGTWYFNCSYTESQNYSASSNYSNFTITQNSSYLLSISATPSWYITYPTSTIVTGAGCPNQLTCNLSIDNVSVANPNTQTLAVGNYFYNFSTTGNANFTAVSASHTLSVNTTGCIMDCSCSSNTCSGSTCSDGCGGTCAGTKSCGGGGGGSDTTYPNFFTITDNQGGFFDSGNGKFSVNVTNTNGQVFLHINGINTAGSLVSGQIYNASYYFLHGGNYSYYWYAYGSGSNNNYNHSATYYYYVSSAPRANVSCSATENSIESSNLYGRLCYMVSVSKPLIFKQSTSFDLNVPMSYEDLSTCTYCTCTISLFYPNGTSLVTNDYGTNNNGYCNYKSAVSVLGIGRGEIYFTDGTNYGRTSFNFDTTVSGEDLSSGQSIMYVIFLIIGFGILAATIYGAIKMPFYNQRNEDNEVTNINWRKYLKLTMMVFSYLEALLLVGLARGIAANFINVIGVAGFFDVFYWLLLALMWPLIVVIVLLSIISYVNDKKLDKMIKRGLVDI